MPIEIAKCPTCSGQINIDTDREKMFCMYCGNPLVVSDVINNYVTNVTNNYNIQNAVIQQDIEVEQMIKNAHLAVQRFLEEMHMKNSFAELNDVRNDLKRIETKAMDNPDYWWACIDVITKHFCHFDTIDDINTAIKYYNRMVTLKGMNWERAEHFYNYLVCVKEEAACIADYYDREQYTFSIMNLALTRYENYLEKNQSYEELNQIEEYHNSLCGISREKAEISIPYNQLFRWTLEDNIKLFLQNKDAGNLDFSYATYTYIK